VPEFRELHVPADPWLGMEVMSAALAVLRAPHQHPRQLHYHGTSCGFPAACMRWRQSLEAFTVKGQGGHNVAELQLGIEQCAPTPEEVDDMALATAAPADAAACEAADASKDVHGRHCLLSICVPAGSYAVLESSSMAWGSIRKLVLFSDGNPVVLNGMLLAYLAEHARLLEHLEAREAGYRPSAMAKALAAWPHLHTLRLVGGPFGIRSVFGGPAEADVDSFFVALTGAKRQRVADEIFAAEANPFAMGPFATVQSDDEKDGDLAQIATLRLTFPSLRVLQRPIDLQALPEVLRRAEVRALGNANPQQLRQARRAAARSYQVNDPRFIHGTPTSIISAVTDAFPDLRELHCYGVVWEAAAALPPKSRAQFLSVVERKLAPTCECLVLQRDTISVATMAFVLAALPQLRVLHCDLRGLAASSGKKVQRDADAYVTPTGQTIRSGMARQDDSSSSDTSAFETEEGDGARDRRIHPARARRRGRAADKEMPPNRPSHGRGENTAVKVVEGATVVVAPGSEDNVPSSSVVCHTKLRELCCPTRTLPTDVLAHVARMCPNLRTIVGELGTTSPIAVISDERQAAAPALGASCPLFAVGVTPPNSAVDGASSTLSSSTRLAPLFPRLTRFIAATADGAAALEAGLREILNAKGCDADGAARQVAVSTTSESNYGPIYVRDHDSTQGKALAIRWK
jgi:hypothetical protein